MNFKIINYEIIRRENNNYYGEVSVGVLEKELQKSFLTNKEQILLLLIDLQMKKKELEKELSTNGCKVKGFKSDASNFDDCLNN